MFRIWYDSTPAFIYLESSSIETLYFRRVRKDGLSYHVAVPITTTVTNPRDYGSETSFTDSRICESDITFTYPPNFGIGDIAKSVAFEGIDPDNSQCNDSNILCFSYTD